MKTSQELENCITKTLASWNIPGAAVAVIHGDESIARGYGVRASGTADRANADTVFAIGSCSKAFTSALVGMLVDEGKLHWDDPVVKYIPDFELYDPWITQNVTVRDLLCHRLGLERAQRLYYHGDYSQRDLMHRMKYLRPLAGFRTQFHYANQQFGVAGLIIEAITGQSWDEFVTSRIFQPAGMTRSFSGYDRLTDFANVALPHAILEETYPAGVRFMGQPAIIPWFRLNHEPSGSILTSANDLARWLRILTQNGAPFLQPATFNEIITPQMVMQDLMNSELAPLYALQPGTHFWTYGFGWWVMDYRGEKVVMHGGGLAGFNTAVAFFPERQMGLAVAVNVHQTLAHAALFYAISDILLGKPERDWSSEFQVVAQGYMAEVKTQVDQFSLTRDPNQHPSLGLEAYTGTFSNDLFGDATVSIADGSLNLAYGMLVATLEHFKADTFLAHWNLKGVQDDSIISFSPDAKTMTLVNDKAEYKKVQ
jgi:CubicO group peptidase (beta-lactamase class C family)